MPTHPGLQRFSIGFLFAATLALPGTTTPGGQQRDSASVIQQVDGAVKARIENIAGYTVTEHYSVFRNQDETHPVAEMTVLTTYQKESGKSYTILSQSGSAIIRKLVIGAILDNEKNLNQPGTREQAWIDSSNYEMKLKPGTSSVGGRDCFVLDLIPKRKASFLIDGTLWVDAKDGSIVQVQGTTSASSSVFTGPAQVKRQYADIDGYPQATSVRAVSDSKLLGETVITISYQNYRVQLRPPA